MKENIALFLIGGPGSGKDYVINNILSRFDLKEYQIDQVLSSAGLAESNMMINCGGDLEKINRAKAMLEGYEFAHIVVSVTNQVSRNRNAMRNRPLTEQVRIRKWLDTEQIIESLDNCFVFKNSINLNNVGIMEQLMFQEQIANTLKFMIDNGYVLGEAKPPMTHKKPPMKYKKPPMSPKPNGSMQNEDLRKWFDQKWVRMDTKGKIKGDCAREEGEGKPKCLPLTKAKSMSKTERAKAAIRKRRQDPVADRRGKGNKPIFVATNEQLIQEKNQPTDPELWSQAKALAKKKFDVYPSAYANGWAAKWYKSKGGGWKSVSEALEDGTTEARNAYAAATPGQTIIANPTLKTAKKKLSPNKSGPVSDFDARFGGAEFMAAGSPFIQERAAQLKEATLTEAVQYHLENQIPITENIFRPGTDKFFELMLEFKKLYEGREYEPKDLWEEELLCSDIGEFAEYKGVSVPLDYPMCEEDDPTKGKGVGKPWREGGGGAVYVRDGDRIRKIRFSQSGMKKRYNEPGRLKSFMARHNCLGNKDKTTASYWACRWPRFFSSSGQLWW